MKKKYHYKRLDIVCANGLSIIGAKYCPKHETIKAVATDYINNTKILLGKDGKVINSSIPLDPNDIKKIISAIG